MSFTYSPGIVITTKWKDGNTFGAITPQPKADDFVNSTKADLDKLKDLPTGAKLLGEIDATGHVVSIYRTKTITAGNAHSPGPNTAGRFVKDLSEKTDGVTRLERIIAFASAQVGTKEYIQKKNFFQKKKVSVPISRFLNRDALAKLLGLTRKELDDLTSGKTPVSDAVKYKVAAYLYGFLEPGEGGDTSVIYNHKRLNLSPDHQKLLPMNENWKHRPPAIALGHELVHAWRFMSGRNLFPYGWEEEAMTVGLPPFSNMDFNENKLRIEHGDLAVRPDYEMGLDRIKTTLLDGQTTDRGGDRNTWQGNSANLHATGPAPLSSGENPTGF